MSRRTRLAVHQVNFTSRATRRLATTLLVALGCLVVGPTVQAADIISRLPRADSEGAFSHSEAAELASGFSLNMAASVSTITWFGSFDSDLDASVTSQGFDVALFADASGVPGQSYFAQSVSAAATSTGVRINTPGPTVHNGDLIYRFTMNLGSPVQIPVGSTQWLGIWNTEPFHFDWLWARSTGDHDPGLLASRSEFPGGLVPWITSTSLGDLAFILDGTFVPEPGMIWMAVGVLVGALRLRPRRWSPGPEGCPPRNQNSCQ